jgi:uncharacterized cupredoxin-like copper-binding protein
MTFLRRNSVAVLVASLGALSAFGLAACSEDDITSGDTDDQVSVSLRDFDIAPERMRVQAGSIEFDVTNDGDRVHEFAVRTPSGDVERTGEIQPGESDSITVDLPAGTHRVFDPLRNYQDRGMTARVIASDGDGDRTVTERTTTIIEEDEPDVDVPEVQEPEVQEPEVQPAPPPPPPPATVTVPAPQEESTTTP